MDVYNHRASTPVSQGYAPNAAHAVNSPLAAAPSTGAVVAAPTPVPAQPPTHLAHPLAAQMRHTPTPPRPALAPALVPTGAHPIELVQFWRGESRRGHPHPLHWALFVRTTAAPGQRPLGNFYELVGTPETYTAQSLVDVTFAPESLPDWRGTHVIGWVHPAHVSAFERAARHVPVWRGRADWRCQQWAHEVVCALAGCEGVGVQRVEFAGVQRQMGWLLEAWENGDI